MLVECLLSMHVALGSTPSTVAFLQSQPSGSGRSKSIRIQGHLCLHSELKASPSDHDGELKSQKANLIKQNVSCGKNSLTLSPHDALMTRATVYLGSRLCHHFHTGQTHNSLGYCQGLKLPV